MKYKCLLVHDYYHIPNADINDPLNIYKSAIVLFCGSCGNVKVVWPADWSPKQGVESIEGV